VRLLLLALVACGSPATVVSVTADGTVLLNGERRTVDALVAAVDPAEPVTVRAAGDAPWLHVNWVLAALGEAGYSEVMLSPDDLRVSVYPGGWEHRIWAMGTKTWPAEVVVDERGRFEVPEGAHDFVVHASGRAPFRSVVAAVSAARAAGDELVDVGLEMLHPWDRDELVLPAPKDDEPIIRWYVTDLTFKILYPVNLPVASMAQEDKDDDPDDRVIVTLTRDGRIYVKEKELTLEQLARHLRDADRAYREKLREYGRPPFDEEKDGTRWSRLYVLLRADRDARWRHVRWILAELAQARFYKVQFGARKFERRVLTPRELERQWAGRDRWPLMLDGKIQCFASTLRRPEASHLVEVVVGGGGAALEKRPKGDVLGRIVAGGDERVGPVIAVLDRFHRLEIEKIDLAGVVRAPADVRRASPLPAVPE